MSHELFEYEPGKWRLIVKEPFKEGTIVRTLEWDFKPSEELVQKAIDWPSSTFTRTDGYEVQLNDRVTMKRFGPFIIGKDVSGPIWKLPRLKIERWSIHGGWRYTAYWISWSPRTPEQKAAKLST